MAKKQVRIALVSNETFSDEAVGDVGQYDKVRIMKLQTCSHIQVAELFGHFSQMFQTVFDLALRTEPSHPISAVDLTIFDGSNGNLPSLDSLADHFDAVLLTGSVSDVWEAEEKPWIQKQIDWVRKLAEMNEEAGQKGGKQVRILGSCFGHQLTNAALGGKVGPNPNGYENGLVHVQLTSAGQRFFNLSSSSLDVLELEEDETKAEQLKLAIMQVHGAAVLQPAQNFEVLARTDITPVQSTLYISPSTGNPIIFTCQWHPEFPFSVVENLIETINVVASRERYPVSQYEAEKKSVEGRKGEVVGSIVTARKMIELAAGLLDP